MTGPRRRLLTAQEVADMTTLSTSVLYDWAAKGLIFETKKFGRRRAWFEDSVLAYINSTDESRAS